MSEIGLRYRPAAQADLIAHAEALRLLTEDLADVPISILETAAKRWIKNNRFMPRAAELIALARELVSDKTRGTDHGADLLQRHCDGLNELNWVRGSRRRWKVLGDAPKRFCAPVDQYGRIAG